MLIDYRVTYKGNIKNQEKNNTNDFKAKWILAPNISGAWQVAQKRSPVGFTVFEVTTFAKEAGEYFMLPRRGLRLM